MEFGQALNNKYNHSKSDVYDAFVKYFENPLLTKIKNVSEYSVYMVKIHCLLGDAYRYLILFVTKDENMLGSVKSMTDFTWISLQTRAIEDNHSILTHSYVAKRMKPLDQKITIETRNEDKSTYIAQDFPLTVTILHTRKNTPHQYQDTGTIISALETFQTIVNF